LTAARAVSARLTARHRVVDAALGLGDVATLIARCDLIVGMRLHALILAALLRRPLAGISYDPKVDEFLSQLGLTALATLPELPPPAELVRRLEDCLDQRERCRALLAERVPRLRAGAERAFEVAAQLLTSPASTPS
ncbi:MAG TPA: polysaccharide pyruvyl transferase family protein, partial [Bacillota bacterium]